MTDRFAGLPEVVHIGPYDIDIRRLDIVDESHSWGVYHSGVSIDLQKAQPSAAFAVDTFLHELGHAVYQIYGAAGDEEHCVSAFATGLTQVFRDNPLLLKWIAARLK